MANDTAIYNYLVTQTPMILTEHKDEINKNYYRISTGIRQTILNCSESIPNWKDYETQQESLELITLLEKAQKELLEFQEIRVELLSDIELLSTALKSNKLPAGNENYYTFLGKLKEDAHINYKNETIKDKRVSIQQDDITTSIKNARKGIEDDDIMAIGGTQTQLTNKQMYRCPLTLQTMIEPMRNTVCRHRYSKQGIMQLLKNNREITCPVAACGRKVTIETLIMDDDFKQEIDQYLYNEAKRKQDQETYNNNNNLIDG